MKKIIFLTSRLPFPTNSGRKNVMYYYCKYLHEMYGYEIVNISFLEKGDDINLRPSFISKVHVLEKPKLKEKIKNISIDTFIKNDKPLQVSMYYNKNIKMDLDKIIQKERPDLLICDMVRTSEYLKNYKIPKILDMDDMLSVRYNRQLFLDLKNINPYGAILYDFPKSLQKILSLKLLKKLILNKEAKLLEEYEKNISKYYNSVVFVAEKEANKMNELLHIKKSFAVPLGVDTDYFYPRSNKKKDKKIVSFLGAINVAHNENGVIYFCEEVLPILKSKVNNVEFQIIGGGVTDKIKNLAKLDNSIIITGRVKDVREYLANTDVFVCPLLFGSGIKTKNLEAMAMKIPIVTTTIGAESISAKNNEDWIISDTPKDMANEIANLLMDDQLNKYIRENGYEYVKNNFTWDINMKKWEPVLRFTQLNNNK